jgi:small-conductance mechanosensitive channel
VRHLETQSEIYAGERLVALVSDEDAAAENRPRIEAAERLLATIRQVVEIAEAERSARGRVTQLIEGVAATLLLVAILLGIRFVSRRLRAVIDARVRTRDINLQKARLVSGARLAGLLTSLVKVTATVLAFIATIAWFQTVLLVLPITRGIARAVAAYVADPLLFVGRALIGFVPNLFYLLVIAGVTWLVLKTIHVVFHEMDRGTIRLGEFRPEWAEPTYKIVRVLVLALALVAAFPYIPGSSSPAFQGVSLFLGLLVSLSSSSAIANVIAGTMLTYTDAFREGDRVRIGETTGDVTRKAMLVTRVRTVKNEVVSIPNSVVLGAAIVNYTRLAEERGLILHTAVTIGYDAPWRTVHELLIASARAIDGVLADPAPFVLQTALDDFYVSYELNVYTRDAGRMAALYSDLHASIQDRFNEAGVEIMSPHFGALRDGNAPAMPETPPGPRPGPGAFRVSSDG